MFCVFFQIFETSHESNFSSQVIRDYTTPPQKELRRDLDAHIRPFINFLAHCRPLSVSMGNAIKYLKREISKIPPDQTEVEVGNGTPLSGHSETRTPR